MTTYTSEEYNNLTVTVNGWLEDFECSVLSVRFNGRKRVAEVANMIDREQADIHVIGHRVFIRTSVQYFTTPKGLIRLKTWTSEGERIDIGIKAKNVSIEL